jgi:hypothetical protein
MSKLVKSLLAFVFVLFGVTTPVEAALPPAQVFVVSGSNINIVSRESKIPVSIQNNYDRQVRIRVHTSAPDPAVTVAEYVSITIPANSRKDALVPISILSGGEYKLNVWLTTFNDIRVGETVSMDLTVNPDIEVMIIIAFGSLIAVLIVLGAIRMSRRSKSGVNA